MKATIDRFEEGKAILKTEDNEAIVWPKSKLPENIFEGMTLDININENDSRDKQSNAKDILNELLGN